MSDDKMTSIICNAFSCMNHDGKRSCMLSEIEINSFVLDIYPNAECCDFKVNQL